MLIQFNNNIVNKIAELIWYQLCDNKTCSNNKLDKVVKLVSICDNKTYLTNSQINKLNCY